MILSNPKAEITGHQTVIDALAAAQIKRTAYQNLLTEHEPILDSENYLRALRAALHEATDAEEIMELSAQMNSLSGPGHESAQLQSKVICTRAQIELKDAITPLLDAAFDVLAELRSETVIAETDFLADYGLPHEITGASRRLDTIEYDLNGFRDGVANFQKHINLTPNAFCSYFDWFVAE